MPVSRKDSSTRCVICSGQTPKFSGPNAVSSCATEAIIWSCGFCITKPICLRARRYSSELIRLSKSALFEFVLPGFSELSKSSKSAGASKSRTVRPRISILPSSGEVRHARTRARVLLPVPFEPTIESHSPSNMSRQSESKTVFESYRKETFLTLAAYL